MVTTAKGATDYYYVPNQSIHVSEYWTQWAFALSIACIKELSLTPPQQLNCLALAVLSFQ